LKVQGIEEKLHKNWRILFCCTLYISRVMLPEDWW